MKRKAVGRIQYTVAITGKIFRTLEHNADLSVAGDTEKMVLIPVERTGRNVSVGACNQAVGVQLIPERLYGKKVVVIMILSHKSHIVSGVNR